MNLPKLTAEHSLGPSQNHYTTTAISNGIVMQSGVVPQQLFNLLADAYSCQAGQIMCQGLREYRLDYTCCDQNEICRHNSNGMPFCYIPDADADPGKVEVMVGQ